MRIYEGMFVLDEGRSNHNWDAVVGEVRGLLERRQAEIFACERWDDRRLAYPIKGRHRAVYLLTRFTVPVGAIAAIQRDCELSDTVLRVLITRDERTEKLHKAGLFPPKPEEPAEEPPGEETEAAPEGGEPQAPAPQEGGEQPPAAQAHDAPPGETDTEGPSAPSP